MVVRRRLFLQAVWVVLMAAYKVKGGRAVPGWPLEIFVSIYFLAVTFWSTPFLQGVILWWSSADEEVVGLLRSMVLW
jgi:hypothetical protein